MTERAKENRTGMRVLAGAGALAGVLLVGLTSCDQSPATLLRANQEPTLELEPLRSSGGKGAQLLRVAWQGEDADGKVTHFEWSLEPEAMIGRETWTETADHERTIDLGSLPPDATGTRTLRFLSVRAVDDLGARSPVRRVGFYGDNIPPEVLLTSPDPSPFPIVVAPTLTFQWQGFDPDGVFTQEPVKYKYILLSNGSEFPADLAFSNPDSLRSYYANHPLGPWAGWDSTGADSTSAHFTNLPFNTILVFCVIGFDEAGDYNPVFSFSTNMTRVRIGLVGHSGPRFTVFNEFLNYQYTLGGTTQTTPISVEIPAQTPVAFNWFAEPMFGTEVDGYRWVLDPDDLFDETPREGPDDLSHWSEWDLATTSATLGPFSLPTLKREKHNLYIEARDDIGNISLAQVEIVVVPALPLSDRRELLIVDDTRFRGDQFAAGQSCPSLPSTPWPMAAELDTALYARGGVPWKCKPAGTLSQPGLFSRYRFDTLGTRRLESTPGVPYSVLSQYRRVIWLVDQAGAGNVKPPMDPTDPTTLLRVVSEQGQYNALAAFIEQGGSVWIAGGGAGYASTDPFNDRNNDNPSKIYSSISGRNELVPGRFMWEFAHWRSEFQILKPAVTFHRSLGRHESDPLFASLPASLQLRTNATDPWPLRPGYSATAGIEYLRADNRILEELNGDSTSVLDTLYRATASTLPDPDPLPPNYVVMTHYHGSESGPVIFSGFGLWDIRRSQMRPVVDFVLQQLWGMSPETQATGSVSARDRRN